MPQNPIRMGYPGFPRAADHRQERQNFKARQNHQVALAREALKREGKSFDHRGIIRHRNPPPKEKKNTSSDTMPDGLSKDQERQWEKGKGKEKRQKIFSSAFGKFLFWTLT